MKTEDHLKINILNVAGEVDLSLQETELRFADGRTVRVPTGLLQQEKALASPQDIILSAAEATLIPLIEERLEVGKRTVVTGKLHLQKSSEAYEVTVDEPLSVSSWMVKRVPKHEIVLDAPVPRQEGNTMIYPLVEERLVLTKELVLIEEVHVTRDLSERRDPQTVTLRRDILIEKRETPDQA